MSETVIRVENLTKEYVLGAHGSSNGLRHVIHDFVMTPFRRLKSAATRLDKAIAADHRVPADKTFLALNDVSFEIKQGAVVGIIGRNGAGKSTLLKVLSRITEPTSGRVEIKGRVASLLEVGTGFHPELSGRENIFLNGSILGMSRAEIKKKFDEIVAFSEVERFLDTPVKRYSSGMYVRLAFAVAAHLEPEILIVDEVLAVGDAQFQKKCLGKMKDVSKGGRTILFVSHNMLAVRELCNHAILLGEGRVVTIGSPEKVAGDYAANCRSVLTNRKNGTFAQPHIVDVELRDQDGMPVASARAGEKTVLKIQIDTKGHKRLIFGMTIFNSDDIGVFSTISSDSQEFIPAETKSLNIDIPTGFLNAGRYRVEGGLSGDGKVLDSNECYLQFEIHRGGAFDLSQQKPRGILRLPGTWSFMENQ